MTPTGVRPSRMVRTVFLSPLPAPSAGKNKGADPRMVQIFTSGRFQCRAQYPAESKGTPWEQDRDFPCSAVMGAASHTWTRRSRKLQKPRLTQGPQYKRWGAGGRVWHTPKEERAAATLVMHYHGNMFCPFWIKGRTSLKSALQCFPSLSLKSPSVPPTP